MGQQLRGNEKHGRAFSEGHPEPSRLFDFEKSEVVMREGADIIENLCNLTYLASQESACPEKVKWYMDMADEQLQLMIKLIVVGVSH